jgi:hypothetical protein
VRGGKGLRSARIARKGEAMRVTNSDPHSARWLEIENGSGQRQRYVRGGGIDGPQAAHVVGLPKWPACTRQLADDKFPEEIIGEMQPSLPADQGTAPGTSSYPYYRFKKGLVPPASGPGERK